MSAIFEAGPRVRSAPGERLLYAVWKLLRLRWVIWIGGLRRADLKRKIGYLFVGLLALAGLVFVFVISLLALRFLRSPELSQVMGDTDELLASVPVLVVSAAFIGILFTSFGVLLQALYLAGDMDFLLSAPVPIRAVFIAKLLQAILPNFGLVLLFSLPVLYGLGIAQGYSALYFPLVLLVLAALALAAAGLSSLLVMGVVRLFPARRVAEVIGFFVAIVSFLCSQSGQIADFADLSGEQAGSMLGSISRLDTPWSPLAWAGRGLVDLGQGQWLPGLGLLILTLGLATGVFYVSLRTAERLYYSGWAKVQVGGRKKRVRKTLRQFPSEERSLLVRIGYLIPSPVRAVIVKDLLVLRRDLRNMSQLVMPIILGAIYTFMFLRRGGDVPLGRGEAPPAVNQLLENAYIYGNVGIALFVSWILLSRLAMMGFSQEGSNYWMLKSAPIGSSRLLLSKFLVAFLPAVALGWGFLLVISLFQGAALSTLVYTLVVVALIIAGTAGVNLAFGVYGANFDWEDPRKMQGGGIGCVGSLASALLLAALLAVFFGPPIVFGVFMGSENLGRGLLAGGLASAAAVFLPLRLVRDRIPRLDEGG